MCVFVWFFIPETKGRVALGILCALLIVVGLSLEKMDQLFGVTQLIDQKNADAERASVRSSAKEVGKPSHAHVETVS